MHLQLGLVTFHPLAEILGVSNRCIGVVERLFVKKSSKNHTSHKHHSNNDASHGIIGHKINNHNNSKILSNPKFYVESVCEVGGVYFSADKSL